MESPCGPQILGHFFHSRILFQGLPEIPKQWPYGFKSSHADVYSCYTHLRQTFLILRFNATMPLSPVHRLPPRFTPLVDTPATGPCTSLGSRSILQIHKISMKQTSQHKAIVLAAFGHGASKRAPGFCRCGATGYTRYTPNGRLSGPSLRKKVRRGITRSGQQADSIDSALDRLKAKGMTRLAVQSLHTAPGSEFENMRDTCMERLQAGEFEALHVGGPLLDSPEDLELAAQGPAHLSSALPCR